MNENINILLGSLIRHGLTAIAGAGFVLSTDLVTQVVNGLVALGTIAYSIYRSKKAA